MTMRAHTRTCAATRQSRPRKRGRGATSPTSQGRPSLGAVTRARPTPVRRATARARQQTREASPVRQRRSSRQTPEARELLTSRATERARPERRPPTRRAVVTPRLALETRPRAWKPPTSQATEKARPPPRKDARTRTAQSADDRLTRRTSSDVRGRRRVRAALAAPSPLIL
jgi:hypothetical protein